MIRVALLLTVLLAPAAAAEAGDTVTITLPPDHGTLRPGPGMEVTERACRMCHSLDYIVMQPRGGEAQWRGVVTKMIKVFGAPIPEDEARAIVQYLSAEYEPGR